jgi:hypothetical protein
VRQQIGGGVDYVLHLERASGRRRVAELVRIKAYCPSTDSYEADPVHGEDS